VRDEARVATMVAETVERFGAPAAAFNVAGTNVLGDLVDLPEEDWDTVVDVCLKGVFLSLKHEARAMGEAGGGAIVNVASLNSRVPFPGGGAYACAKAGVEMLTRNAARELAPRRIRVNAVSPGLTDTPLVAPIRQVPGAEAAYLERIPMERWGRPEEMAAAALFLASDDASYVTGANLFVDGGWETTGYPDLRPLLAGKRPGASAVGCSVAVDSAVRRPGRPGRRRVESPTLRHGCRPRPRVMRGHSSMGEHRPKPRWGFAAMRTPGQEGRAGVG
jgi:NAD(P)-dependent dehydrogenase (short-subunit alcohol dehydrogenase family)